MPDALLSTGSARPDAVLAHCEALSVARFGGLDGGVCGCDPPGVRASVLPAE